MFYDRIDVEKVGRRVDSVKGKVLWCELLKMSIEKLVGIDILCVASKYQPV